MKQKKRTKKNKFKIYNVRDIVKLEERERVHMKLGDRLADKVTSISGNIGFVYMHIIWFACWLLINTGQLSFLAPFDPFPFGLLTTMVSLEAIFLSLFVLISQNRQALLADKRAKVDLQINTINERESTKLLEMTQEIQTFLGISKKSDTEVKELKKKTNIATLAKKLDEAEEKLVG
jgi:uncharacterized membrane protein